MTENFKTEAIVPNAISIQWLWTSSDGDVHLCTGDHTIPDDPCTFLVWTLCERDVPANMSYLAREEATCQECRALVSAGRSNMIVCDICKSGSNLQPKNNSMCYPCQIRLLECNCRLAEYERDKAIALLRKWLKVSSTTKQKSDVLHVNWEDCENLNCGNIKCDTLRILQRTQMIEN